MKITQIETVRIDEHPNLCWVLVHTDDGIAGLGETFFGAQAVEAYLHETAAPLLIGRDPLSIDAIARSLIGYVGFASTGTEMRGNSAIDIALWDIFGKVTGQPIAQLRWLHSPGHPHLQYLCRHRLHEEGGRGRQLRSMRRAISTLTSTPSSIAPTTSPRSCSPKASRQ